MRINKYIAQAGVASRRKADELIANGNVTVNGAVMKEPGYDVQEEAFSGITESTATANAKAISGFTYDADHAGNVTSGIIAGDGSLVLKLYYTRNS